MLEFITLETGKTYRFKAEIDYQKKAKFLSVKYYLDDKFILHHYDVPLLTKKLMDPMDQPNLILKLVFIELEKQAPQLIPIKIY